MRIGLILLFILSVTQVKSQKLSKKAVVSDINNLITTIERVHPDAYFKVDKSKFLRVKEDLIANLPDSISLRQFMSETMVLTAYLSGGHTRMDWVSPVLYKDLLSFKYCPILITEQNNEIKITKAYNTKALHGKTIHSINSIPITSLLNKIYKYSGGIDEFKKSVSQSYFSLLLFFNEAIEPPYHLKFTSGETTTINGIGFKELQELLSGKAPKEPYTYSIKNNIAHLEYNSCENYDGFKVFLKDMFKSIHDKKVNKLIVDIRENGGGDSSLNELLLAYFTRKHYRQAHGRYWKVSQEVKNKISQDSLWKTAFSKAFLNKYLSKPNGMLLEDLDWEMNEPVKPEYYFKGQVVLLTGPKTFSSANFLADAIKTYNLATIIGQPTGENTNDYGEIVEFTLPNSKAVFYVSTTYDIGADANANRKSPVIPDIYVKNNVLEYALEWITK